MKTLDIPDLSLELGRVMNEMKSRLRQLIQARINEIDPGLSYELLEIIGLLWRKNGINQQEIGEHVSKNKSSITYLINCLVKRGLVERVANPNDRRNKQIFLTRAGKEKRKVVFPIVLELYNQAGRGMDAAEINSCISLIRRMTNNLY